MLTLSSLNVFAHSLIERKSESKRKKVRERLKELSTMMSTHRLVAMEWLAKWDAMLVMFNTGLITRVYFNKRHDRVVSVSHDRYLLNKLLSEHVVSVEFRHNCLLVSYTMSKLTFISIDTDGKRQAKHKLSASNPRITSIELENVTTRRVERKLVLNDSGDLLIVWWKTGTNTVAPWSAPGRRARELANIFVYSFSRKHFELVAFSGLAGEIFQISFMDCNPNQLVVLHQSGESSYVLNYTILEMSESFESLQQVYSIRIPILQPCLKAQFTSALDKIVLLCNDNTINLFNIEQNALYSLHSSVNAFDFNCNELDAIFAVADQFGRISLYDYAFNTIRVNYEELFGEDEMFHLKQIKFLTPTKLCLLFNEDNAHIVLISLPDAIDNKTLINLYMRNGKHDEAIAALQAINWNCYSDDAYFSLNSVFNYLIKQPFNAILESQLEKTLAVFFTPSIPIDDEICQEYKLSAHYLAKRFFYHLLRYNCLDKAFLLGVDLKSQQLFTLLSKIARERGNDGIADAALLKVEQYGKQHNNEKHRYYTDEPNLSSNSNESGNREPNNNNFNADVPMELLPVSLALNTVGLPPVNNSQIYNNHAVIDYRNHSSAKTPQLSSQMPIASILKSSSAVKSMASIAPTKPKSVITFGDLHESSSNETPVYALSTKKVRHQKQLDYYPNGDNNDDRSADQLLVDSMRTDNNPRLQSNHYYHENIDTTDSMMSTSFMRSSLSSSSSSSSTPSTSSSSITSSSYTSASLSLQTTPPQLPASDPPPLCPIKLTPQFSLPPPELPPRTYLMRNFIKPPERPPKTMLVNENNNLEPAPHLSEHELLLVDTSVPINLAQLKSQSKIECIHFGVV